MSTANDIQPQVQAERDRCQRIIQAARQGDIETDLRTLAHFIRSGDQMTFNEAARAYECDSKRKARELSEKYSQSS